MVQALIKWSNDLSTDHSERVEEDEEEEREAESAETDEGNTAEN